MTDKAWLKEELLIDLMRFNGNSNMTDYELGIVSGIRTAINLTEKLDEPEITFEQVHDKLREESILSKKSFDYYWNCINDNVEIDEPWNIFVPKKDKPVIPKFVADYIERWKPEGLTICEWFTFGNNDMDDDIEKWLYNNTVVENRKREYLLIDAIRNGYEVEKEELYHVVNKENYFLLRKYDGLVDTMQTSPVMSRDKYGKDMRFMLTEKEIKDYDERFWVFAKEVVE